MQIQQRRVLEYSVEHYPTLKKSFQQSADSLQLCNVMNSGRYKWKKIADSIEEISFASNNMTVIEVDDKKVTLIKKADAVYACANKCPHAGGIMSEGFLDAAGNIVCPLHRYRFNPQTGRNVSGEGYFIKHWPIEKRPDGIYIGMEEKGLFHF